MTRTFTASDALALPALPGLLVRGAPLVGPYGKGAVFLDFADCGEAHVNLATDDGTDAVALGRLALDLGEWSGRARVAQWLAEGGHPAWWALDGPGAAEPWVSAAVLWASVQRVATGRAPILGVLSQWRPGLDDGGAAVGYARCMTAGSGWPLLQRACAGHEAAMQASDAHYLHVGYALWGDDGTSIAIEVPS